MEHNVVLTMRGITMTFPGVKALDNVDLTLRKGEIMALMGENGAGKSTLIKCLTGINAFDAGEIRVDGGQSFDPGCTEKGHIHGVSGSQSLPEFECGRKFIYRQGAEDKAWNHRLEDDDSKIQQDY